MTSHRFETPLRRSAADIYHGGVSRVLTPLANNELERREACRRSLFQHQQCQSTLESIEDNEKIRQCLEMYSSNKLSKDNAWNLTLIDSLANLLEDHHKRMSNFRLAGSSLEASSKVYGLRVDSIYMDAMRISAGLSARTLTDKQLNAAEDDDGPQPDQAPAEGQDLADQAQKEAAPKPKRQKKPKSTVTKNRDTLNSRLDTASLQDPVFGKLKSTVGSINDPNRLMHNILTSLDSELRLRTTYRFWNSEECTEEVQDHTTLNADMEQWPAESLISTTFMRELLPHAESTNLRPLHTGYIISSAPNPKPMQDEDQRNEELDIVDEISMAFDINAECEPMPDLDVAAPLVLEVDSNELDELTTEEQMVLKNCGQLRKPTEFLKDLRPVDGNSKLEYCYRPMENISQFWAGPSHWKFKRTTKGPEDNRSRRPKMSSHQTVSRKAKALAYDKVTEEAFEQQDSTKRQRRANFLKWDPRKLVLPTQFNLGPDFFYKYDSAPSIKLSKGVGEPDLEMGGELVIGTDDELHHGADNDEDLFNNELFTDAVPADVSIVEAMALERSKGMLDMTATSENLLLEIGTEFEGAPSHVTKVNIPYAKQAKVIDMKNLKRSCNSLIQKQLLNDVPEDVVPSHPRKKDEQYAKGVASFQKVYEELPNHLTPKMADSLSPAVAFYSVLHLANDSKMRLIPQEDLKDFKIRKILD
ncbi:condensin complex subunit 2-like [Drosophila biarmipes]|uniref:condensin complex subunit 2-like n=1 Tax=Drosophila biarmipes TaxID=125945 RepID=UPI0007E6BB38|nr:condensin complex subunit 2-like [Drosophila biarmipes]